MEMITNEIRFRALKIQCSKKKNVDNCCLDLGVLRLGIPLLRNGLRFVYTGNWSLF